MRIKLFFNAKYLGITTPDDSFPLNELAPVLYGKINNVVLIIMEGMSVK
ncbi:MAG: hypothetical protein IPK25_09490 [Saprospiraceae bacterium]|nr:hypothetical protein [Saprospiraceae bacterium]